MDLGISGKVALVAASSRGLGRAIADELAAEGADLLMCARSAEPLERARADVERESGRRVVALPTDLSDPEATERLVAAGLDAFGRIDILVTNCGGPPPGPFESHSPEAWRKAVAQNLESVLNLVRGVLPGMRERRWGRILNVTSVAVKQPVDGLILSNSVRAAVTGFARTLATEVAGDGVTVNNVLPGYTRTERLDELAASIAGSKGVDVDAAFAAWENEVPMKRIGQPREFAAVVAFLASERASYITGASVPVDGGWIRSLF